MRFLHFNLTCVSLIVCGSRWLLSGRMQKFPEYNIFPSPKPAQSVIHGTRRGVMGSPPTRSTQCKTNLVFFPENCDQVRCDANSGVRPTQFSSLKTAVNPGVMPTRVDAIGCQRRYTQMRCQLRCDANSSVRHLKTSESLIMGGSRALWMSFLITSFSNNPWYLFNQLCYPHTVSYRFYNFSLNIFNHPVFLNNKSFYFTPMNSPRCVLCLHPPMWGRFCKKTSQARDSLPLPPRWISDSIAMSLNIEHLRIPTV